MPKRVPLTQRFGLVLLSLCAAVLALGIVAAAAFGLLMLWTQN